MRGAAFVCEGRPLRTVFLAVILAAALTFPPAAQSAPFAIGEGHKPGVAVDPDGTAYIAWYGPESGDTSLHFCRVARGAQTCAGQSVLATSGSSLSRPAVVVAGARVSIVQHRYGPFSGGFNQMFLYTSLNGGDTFDAGVPVGYVPFDEAVHGPGDTLSVATNAFQEGGLVQNVPLSGGSAGEARAGLFGVDRPYNGTVGLDGGTVVAVFANGAGDAALRRYSGSGAINDAGTWSPERGIGYADYPRLAGGRSGLFLLNGTDARGLEVRRFDGTGFSAPQPLSASGDDAQASFFQDPSGRLHAVFPRGESDGFHVVHAISDDGTSWDSATVAVQATELPAQTRVATAPDHIGVAAWESGGQVRVAAIGPGAADSPVPQFDKTVVVKPVSGTVRVREPGSSRFVDLRAADEIRFGSTVDAKRGRLALSSVPSRAGAIQSVQLYSGRFKVTRSGSVTQFELNEPLASCGGGARTAAAKPKSRKLWGDGKGKFRTKGRYSAATVRGTKWLVQDSCSGTLTRVTSGSVLVRDAVRKRNVIVRAGKRYTARPR